MATNPVLYWKQCCCAVAYHKLSTCQPDASCVLYDVTDRTYLVRVFNTILTSLISLTILECHLKFWCKRNGSWTQIGDARCKGRVVQLLWKAILVMSNYVVVPRRWRVIVVWIKIVKGNLLKNCINLLLQAWFLFFWIWTLYMRIKLWLKHVLHKSSI